MAAHDTAAPSTPIARTTRPGLLRAALRADAVVTGTNGAAYLLAAGPLADLFDVPAGGLRVVGAFLLVFAAAVWAVGATASPNPTAVRTVVACNAAWVAGSLAAVGAGMWSPSTTGAVWIVLQAGVVAAFAALQTAGLRVGSGR